MLWENGKTRVLWDNYSRAQAINNHGQVVGQAQFDSGSHAFLWENGVMADLGTLGGISSFAWGMNDNGQVVGASNWKAGESGWDKSHAFLWENGVMIDLGTLGGNYSRATDINNQGQIVGESYTASGELHAFLWENGVMTNLHVLLSGDGSEAWGINDLGQIVGGHGNGAYQLENGILTELGGGKAWDNNELGQTINIIGGINDHGQVASRAYANGRYFAYLHDNGTTIDLGWLGDDVRAYDINNLGQIVGEAEDWVDIPSVIVSPSIHSFGNVPVGNSSDVAISIKYYSYSPTDLNVTALELSDSINYTLSNVTPIAIPPFGSHTVTVIFNPKSTGIFHTTLTIETDFPDEPIIEVSMIGVAGVYYNVIDLGSLGGDYSEAYDINNNGQVVGHARNAERDRRATLFDTTGGGNNIDLTSPEGHYTLAASINEQGQVVGYQSWSTHGSSRATLFDINDNTKNILLSSSHAIAYGINNNGQIVGGYPAVIFDPTGGGNNTNLADSGSAQSINEHGQIVGYYGSRLYLFDPTGIGNNIDLGTLGGTWAGSWGYVGNIAINNFGQIVGSSETAEGEFHATLFDITGNGNNIDLKALSIPGYTMSNASSINHREEIVGHSCDEEYWWPCRATLFDITGSGKNLDLNDLIDPNSGWFLEEATDINDNGWIVGVGQNPEYRIHAFLLKLLTKSLTVNSPNGGEELHAGSSHGITWTSEDGINYVKIEYSVNNGSDWSGIVESTENDGSYNWIAPVDPSDKCLVRVSDVDGDTSDVSDALFSIIRLNQAPVADAGSDQTISADAMCEATVTLNGAGSFDPDNDPLSYNWTWSGGSSSEETTTIILPLGEHTITLHVDDGKDGIDSDSVVITVKDNIAPIPDLESLPKVSGQCSATINEIPIATDNCAGIINGTTSDPLTYTEQGTYSVSWTFEDANGNVTTQTQTVIVGDTTAPVPNLPELPMVTGECSATVLSTPKAADNCAGEITGTTSNPLSYLEQGTYTVTWIYNDGKGNTSTQSQTVIVKDLTAPIPDETTLPTATGECSAEITSAPTATDNCVGTIIGTTSDPLTYTQQGTYTVNWAFDDGNGQIATQAQNVIVDDITPPSINLSASPAILWPPNHKMKSVNVSVSSSDNCDPNPACKIISVESNEPVNGSGDGDTTPDWEITGDLSVDLRAERSGNGDGRVYMLKIECSDSSGNNITADATVTVPHDNDKDTKKKKVKKEKKKKK